MIPPRREDKTSIFKFETWLKEGQEWPSPSLAYNVCELFQLTGLYMYQIRSVIFLSLSFSKFWCHLSATLTHSNNWDRLEFHPELPASFNTQTNSRVVVMPSFCLIAQVNLTQGSVTVNHVKSWGIKIEGIYRIYTSKMWGDGIVL